MNVHNSLIVAWDWSQKWGLPINRTKCNYLAIGRKVPLRLSFYPDGSGMPVPVSKIVKDLEVQAYNVFSPSASANKARRLTLVISRSFQGLSKSAFILLKEDLVRPHLDCGIPACLPNLMAI